MLSEQRSGRGRSEGLQLGMGALLGWAQQQELREGGFSPGTQGRNPLGFTLLEGSCSVPLAWLLA